MCQHNPKNQGRRIDPCLKKLIEFLNDMGIETVSCCCGHGKYEMVIFVTTEKPNVYLEICHDVYIESKAKRFFKTDDKGRYYVPEIEMLMKEKKKNGNSN